MTNSVWDAGQKLREETFVRGALHRLSLITAMAVASAYWVGWLQALAFFVIIIGYEALFLFVLARPFIIRHEASDPARAERNGSIFAVIGGSIYVLGWAPTFITGEVGAGYFAAVSLAGILVHSLLYLGETRRFALAVAPSAFAAMLIPFLIYPLMTAFAVALGSFVLLSTALLALKERTALLNAFIDGEVNRKQAEAASVAKSDFLATMSHELRTPLNAVIGYAEILEEDLDADGNRGGAADAGRIRRSARDLLGLINEVLDFSKIEAGRMEIAAAPTDIAALLRETVDTTSHIAQANNNTVTLLIDAAIDMVEVDASRLRQCVLNLLSNACKFTTNGAIKVSAWLTSERHDTMLIIEVADTGAGISRADQERLFQPFVQADGSKTRRYEGTGLGLAITRRLARLMGGDVACQSERGVGSTFTLRVRAGHSLAQHPDAGEGPLVLVIDDNPDARDLTCRAASRLPVRVAGVATGAEGLARAAAETPALIVLDIGLPDQSGWDVLEKLKADPNLAQVPVIICTIHDEAARAHARGAAAFVHKPVDRDALSSAIARLAPAEGARAA